VTFGEIKALFWPLAGMSAGNPYFSNANLITWANMSVRDMVSESRCLERRQKLVVTAGTQTYDLPSDCDRVRRAAYDGDKLLDRGMFELQISAPKWDIDTGIPRWYFVDGLNEQIGLYKIPTTSTTVTDTDGEFGGLLPSDGWGGIVDATVGERLPVLDGGQYEEITGFELELYFSCRPAEITQNDSVLDVPAWAHPVVLYSLLRFAFSAQTPMMDKARAAYWGDLYAHGKDRLIKQSNDRLPKDWRFLVRSIEGRPKIGRLPDLIVDTR